MLRTFRGTIRCCEAAMSGQVIRCGKAVTSGRMVRSSEAVTAKQLEGPKQLRTHREFQANVVMVALHVFELVFFVAL